MADLTTTSEVLPRPPAGTTVEGAIDALPRMGISKLGWVALLVTYFFANYENAILAVVLPSLMGGLGLTADQLAWPVAWNLIGFAVGAYFLGYLADKFGRQMGLRLTFLVLGLGGLLSGFSWDEASLSAFRFLAGCGMGAVLALCTGYIGEMSAKHKRGASLAMIAFASTVTIAAASMASLPLIAASPNDGCARQVLETDSM